MKHKTYPNGILYNGDCLKVIPRLIKQGIQVDAIITDVPYGTVQSLRLDKYKSNNKNFKYNWDKELDFNLLFQYFNSLLRKNGVIILFSQEPLTNKLRNIETQIIKYAYKFIWIKNQCGNFLGCNRNPLNFFEEILVFKKIESGSGDSFLKSYSKSIQDFINLPYTQIKTYLNHNKLAHFFANSSKSSQCRLPTLDAYNDLINQFHINNAPNFIPYDSLKSIINQSLTFNIPPNQNFISNVLYFNKDKSHFHPTQKPIKLMEHLINIYSNPNDTILDFTCGSGSTLIACQNLNRKFIGIELDSNYYKIAKHRLKLNQNNNQD